MRLEGAVNAGEPPIKLLRSFGWDVGAGARLREQPCRKLEPPEVLKAVLSKAKVASKLQGMHA